MATFTVWKFSTAEGADAALETLKELQKQNLINVLDGAVVTWPAGKRKPKTHEMRHLTGGGALGGAFWGLLFGLIFTIPLFGIAFGAAMGALHKTMTNVGITDEFIDSVREKITPGTSALFVMSQDAVMDKVRDAFHGAHAELIETNLSVEEEAKLREAFADD